MSDKPQDTIFGFSVVPVPDVLGDSLEFRISARVFYQWEPPFDPPDSAPILWQLRRMTTVKLIDQITSDEFLRALQIRPVGSSVLYWRDALSDALPAPDDTCYAKPDNTPFDHVASGIKVMVTGTMTREMLEGDLFPHFCAAMVDQLTRWVSENAGRGSRRSDE